MNANTEAISSVRGEAAEHGLKALDQSKDKLLSDLKTVVNDAQALMREAVDTSAQGVNQMPAYFEKKADAVKERLQQARTAVETKARKVGAATDHYVRENPWKSVGFASMASIFVSVLLVSASMASMWKSAGGKK